MLSPIIQIINAIAYVVGLVIPILIGVALIFFFLGLVQYIRNAGEKGHDQGKKTMIAGITALFIMVSVWGIIAFAQSALGVRGNANSPQNAPYIPTYSGGSAY
jgi:uncharacterized membrane-anchored protein